MIRKLAAALLIAATTALGTSCRGTHVEGDIDKHADLAGTWVGSWVDGVAFGNAWSMVLTQTVDAGTGEEVIAGAVFSSEHQDGTVTGSIDGNRFTLTASYADGFSETYRGREELGTVNGEYASGAGEGSFSMKLTTLARSGSSGAPGTVTGRVLVSGTPVAGVKVSIGVGPSRQETTTDGAGTYSLGNVGGGPRVVVASQAGRATALSAVVVDGDEAVPDISLVAGATPAAAPVIGLDTPADGLFTASAITLSTGSITGVDGTQAVVSINDAEYLLPLDANAFTYVVLLGRGVNHIGFQATNGTGFAERFAIVESSVPNRRIRVTLVWDQGRAGAGGGGTANDQDLHLWYFPPGGGSYQHAHFGDKEAIAGGAIDVDNTYGYGPENFTMQSPAAGTYYVAVNYFGGATPTADIVRISLNEGTPQEQVYLYGPVTLSVPSGGTGYPVAATTTSWWRVADLTVDPNGYANLAGAPNPNTSIGLNE